MKKILIVDDVQANRELIREALTSPEYQFSAGLRPCNGSSFRA